jgi:hypothetical protein
MSRISILTVCLGASLIACAGGNEDNDELAGESAADGEDSGKADGSGTFTYHDVRPDLRRCAAPACGGYFVDRVNRAQTKCAVGWAEQCYVAELDWSQSGLDQYSIDKVRTYISEAAVNEKGNAKVLVRGEIEKRSIMGAEYGVLVVTEAWLGASEGVSDGVFVKIEDAGVRCIAAPCESSRESKLNSTLTAMIAGVDFEPTGLDDETIAALGLWEAMFHGGVIVSGERYYVHQDGRSGKARRAFQVYVRMTPPAEAPCYVGGCSGQLCTDEPGAVSTCEWRPEYACYQTATCARQADGACGWTETPELTSCLASPPE